MDEVIVADEKPERLPPQPLRFTGSGQEYFGIWIVNLLLTIITVGIYASWAKVRRLHYFYRHTELAGSSFDYHGDPLRIFFGRLIAVVLLLLYEYALRFPSKLTLVIIAVLALIFPWLMRNSLRFRLRNSSWRGLRFSFHGGVAGAYKVMLLYPLLAGLSFGLLWPFAYQRFKRYQHENSRLGKTSAHFNATVGSFYFIFFVISITFVVLITAYFSVAVGVFHLSFGLTNQPRGAAPTPESMRALHRMILGTMLPMYAIMLLIGPSFSAWITNTIWSGTVIGDSKIECRESPLKLTWIILSNIAMVLLTLGFFYPWAAVRLMRFRVEAMTLIPWGTLDEFAADSAVEPGAIGEEVMSVFDLDIGL